MKRFLPLLGIGLVLLFTGCIAPTTYSRRQAPPPAPCLKPVGPIRNVALISLINVNYTYTPKDAEGGRTWHRDDVLSELNSLGVSDGNTFAEPNGQQPNFYFTYSITNDGQDHFTGSLQFSGWGEGNIHNFSKYQYPYASSAVLVKDLTDEAYAFIHGGWHDNRPQCPQN